jgi:hypothetical protein
MSQFQTSISVGYHHYPRLKYVLSIISSPLTRAELAVSGARPPVRTRIEADSDIEMDDPLFRDKSAASVRSAPVILQRPSSRGGSAFDISFEGEESTP